MWPLKGQVRERFPQDVRWNMFAEVRLLRWALPLCCKHLQIKSIQMPFFTVTFRINFIHQCHLNAKTIFTCIRIGALLTSLLIFICVFLLLRFQFWFVLCQDSAIN